MSFLPIRLACVNPKDSSTDGSFSDIKYYLRRRLVGKVPLIFMLSNKLSIKRNPFGRTQSGDQTNTYFVIASIYRTRQKFANFTICIV